VDENVLSPAVGCDKAEALFAVEPLHSSLCHSFASLIQSKERLNRAPRSEPSTGNRALITRN
jgi:hypothetical protein